MIFGRLAEQCQIDWRRKFIGKKISGMICIAHRKYGADRMAFLKKKPELVDSGWTNVHEIINA